MLTLYDDVFSPYARKVRIALYEKGVPFERVRALHGDCNRTDFMHVNPRAEVPALVDGDFSLYDSTVICEYLEDRHPEPPLYPRDARLRAKCRLIEDLADTQLDAALYAVSVVEFGRGEAHPAMHEAAARDITRLSTSFEARLGDGASSAASTPSPTSPSRRISWRQRSSASPRMPRGTRSSRAGWITSSSGHRSCATTGT